MARIVTLTTDFGTTDGYVAAMKGVILSEVHDCQLVDVSHSVPPQQIRAAAYICGQALPMFPSDALHIVVVDPGVGSRRRILLAESACGLVMAPDNGFLSLLSQFIELGACRSVENRKWFRVSVSRSFHGRDIFAPVACQLLLGGRLEEVGPIVNDAATCSWPQQHVTALSCRGEVIHIDHFGNLITNISFNEKHEGGTVRVTDYKQPIRLIQNYAQGEEGEVTALWGSGQYLEIVVKNGHAARQLDAAIGLQVELDKSQ